jgi:hypothetical protein
VHKSAKNYQPIHILLEDGSCSVCRNVGQHSTFIAAKPRTQAMHSQSVFLH